jgi:hypothetical protein
MSNNTGKRGRSESLIYNEKKKKRMDKEYLLLKRNVSDRKKKALFNASVWPQIALL